MNHIYRVVFNARLGLWQAVCEIARSGGGGAGGVKTGGALVLGALIASLLGSVVVPGKAYADNLLVGQAGNGGTGVMHHGGGGGGGIGGGGGGGNYGGNGGGYSIGVGGEGSVTGGGGGGALGGAGGSVPLFGSVGGNAGVAPDGRGADGTGTQPGAGSLLGGSAGGVDGGGGGGGRVVGIAGNDISGKASGAGGGTASSVSTTANFSFDYAGIGGGGGGGGGGLGSNGSNGTQGSLTISASTFTVNKALLIGGAGGGGGGYSNGGNGGNGTVTIAAGARVTMGNSGKLFIGGIDGENGRTTTGGTGGNGVLNLGGYLTMGTGSQLTVTNRGTLNFGNDVAGDVTGGTVNAAEITNNGSINFNQLNSTYTLSSNIIGSGSVNHNSVGSTILSGTNTYSGGTFINSGILKGTTSSFGSGAIVNDASLILEQTGNGTLANSISGSGSLNKNGAGNVTLSGNSSAFAGKTNVNDGGLIINNAFGTTFGTIAANSNSANANVTVTGSNAVWTTSGSISVGSTTGQSSLTVNNGGKISSTLKGTIGSGTGSTGTVILSNPNSSWTIGDELIVGDVGGTGTLQITDGAVVSNVNPSASPNVFIGRSNGSSGNVLVTGANSSLSTGGTLYLGNAHFFDTANSSLSITNGGKVTSANAELVSGGFVGGIATVQISGANSSWTNGGTLIAGATGSASISLDTGGVLKVGANGAGTIELGKSSGTINIGAAVGSTAVGAGQVQAGTINFGTGTAKLNFNHTDSNYVLSSALTAASSGTHAINQIAGNTTLSADNSSFNGLTTVSGGTLVVADRIGGSAAVTGGTLQLGTASSGRASSLTGDLNVSNAGSTLAVQGSAVLNQAGKIDLGNGTGLSIAPSTSTTSVNAGSMSIGTGVNLNLSGISTPTDLGSGRVLIATTNGIGGDFASVNVSGFSSPVDYMTVNTRKSADSTQYLASYDLSWTANNPLAHGTFTLSNASDSYEVSAGLSNQTANAALSWDGKSLTKNGLGTLILSGTNTYTGTSTINGGTLQLGNGGTAGSVGSSPISIGQGAVLAVNRSDAVTLSQVIDGKGSLLQNGINTTTLTGANEYTGGTTITQGTLALSANGSLAGTGAVNLAGNGTTFDISAAIGSQTVGALSGVAGSTVALGGNALTFGDGSNQTLAATVSGINGSLIKNDTGTTLLTGTNTYTGGTTVNGGKLLVGDATQGGSVAGNVQVNTGAALGGSGSIGGNVTVGSGGTLSPGNSPGTLTIGGDLTLTAASGGNPGSTTVFELGQAGTVGGSSNDLIKVGGSVNLGGTLDATVASAGWYRLINYGISGSGSVSGQFDSTALHSSSSFDASQASASVLTSTPNQVNLAVVGQNQSLQLWNGVNGNTWDANTVNWTNNAPTSGITTGWQGSVAVFGTDTGATPGTVTVSGQQSFDTLQFSSSGYTVAAASSADGLLISPASSSNPQSGIINVDPGVSAEISANIANGTASSLSKVGRGTLTLSGNNSYTGGTTISNGTLNTASNSAFGTGAITVDGSTSALNVNSGVSLSNAVTLSNEATLNNAGTLTATGTTVSGNSGSVTVNNSTGAVINPGAGGTAIDLQGGGTVNNAGSIGNLAANVGVSLQKGGSIDNQAGSTIVAAQSVQATGSSAVNLRNAGSLIGDVQLDGSAANAVILLAGSSLQGNLNIGTNTGSTLLLDGTGSQSYASAVTGDTTLAGALTKTGTGTWTVDKNLGSGFAPASTTIADGTLALSGAGTLGSGSSLNLSGSAASYDISAANAGQTVSTLAGVAGSQIHLGANNLSFGGGSNQTFAGSIDGSGGITKTGTGTQMLSGTNSYTGGTTISAGTLQLGDGTSTGQGSIVGNITNNGALVVNNLGATTLAGNISGAGTLTQQGSGTTTLTGTNHITGNTTINAGALQLGDGTAAGSGTVLGNVINNAALVVNNAGAVTIAGSISGAGTVTQQGTGTTTLAGDNSYQGTTTIGAGTLQVGTGGTAGTLGAGVVVNNGTLALDRSDTVTVANSIGGSGALEQQGTGTTVLTGNNSYGGSTTIAAGTLQVGAGGTAGNLGAGAVTNNGTLVLNRSDATTVANAISGTGALTQQGSGAVTLTGNTSYSGDTQINAGSLTFAGASNALGGNVNVAAGAVLGIASSAPVAVAGTVNLGNASILSISSLVAGANLTASGVQLGSGVGLNLSGITSASQLDRVLISTTNGISGDFGSVTIGGFSGPVDYMTLNTGKSADGKQYLASYKLSWTANNSLAHGNFTLNNSTDRFDLGAGLSNQTPNAALGWDGRSLTQNGAGTLILSGTNSYTGSTTINGGTLQLGNGGTTGNLGTGSVINNGTLAFDRSDTSTIANDIRGTGGLLQQGTGTTVLAGNNTYQGGTAITGGTLQVDADTRLGAASGGLSLNGGTLHTTASTTTQRQITLGAVGGSFSPDAGTALTVASAIQGTGGLTQAGAGSMVLTGNNSYQGTSTINSGTLQVGAGGTAGTLGAGAVTNNGTLILNRSDAVAVANAISGAGNLVQQGTGTTALTGNNSYSGATTIAAGTLQVGTGGTTGMLGTGAVTNNGVLSINRSDATTLAQSITGSGALQQVGTGTTTLTGSNSYTGGTVVAAGTLQAGSAGALVQNSSYYLNQGATLDLNGHALQTSMLMGSGNVLLGSGDLTVSNAAGQTDSFAGQIAGAGHLIKQGAGTLSLSGASSLTGGVNLKQGRINLGNAQGLGTGTLSMDDGTTLGLTANGMTIANNLRMTGTNDPVIDTGTNSATWAGAISGAGFLTKQGTGTLTLTSTANNYTGATEVAQGTLQAGAANTFSSTSAHNVTAGAMLDLAGYSQTLVSLNNSGTVKLSSNGGGTPGAVLKVTGPYVGNGGTLGLSTVLAADGSATDKLLLSGTSAVASGSTTIQITNAGGLGAQTTGAGIQVVGTENGGSLQANSFALAGGHVDAGAYEYRLFQTAQGATLHSTNTQLAYRSEVPLMSALPAQLRQADMAMLGDMHKRMGDDNVQASNGTGNGTGTTSADLGQNRRAWGRILRTDPTIRQQGTVSPESSGHMTGFQAGLDLYADQSVKAGIYVGQLDGDMSTTGFAGGINSKYVGFNTLRSRYLGVYGSWKDASGLYADAVLQGADYRSQLHTAENTSANAATTKGSGWLASLEVGKPFAINSNWQIEPQAQLIYRKISLDDTALSMATVKNRADDDWTLRLGARIKGSFTTSAGVLQPYGRINVYKASSTTDVASFVVPAATTDIKAKGGYTATELAAGASLQLSKSTSVYGELGKLWANGGDSRVKSGVQASVGIKILW